MYSSVDVPKTLSYPIKWLVFFFLLIPLGAFSGIKNFSLIILLFGVFFNFNALKCELFTLFLYSVLLVLITASFLYFCSGSDFYVESFTQYQSIIISILVFFIITTSVNSGVVSSQELVRYAVIGLTIYSLIKTGMVILIYLGVIEETTMKLISPDMNSLGYIGDNGFIRVVGVNDYLIPYLYFVIDDKKIPFPKFIRAIMIVSVFLSFSRYLWAVFILMYSLQSIVVEGRYVKLVLFLLFLILCIIFLDYRYGFDFIGSINHRINDEGTLSTDAKIEQVVKMFDEIAKSPLLGKGLGGYIPDLIRNERLKYGYEVVILSLVMQLGLINACVIVFIFAYGFYKNICKHIYSKKDLFILLIFLFYIISGFSNPVVISVVSSIFYCIMTGYFLEKKYNREREF